MLVLPSSSPLSVRPLLSVPAQSHRATAECPGLESQGSQMPPHSRVFPFATILPFDFNQAGLFLFCNLLTPHLLLFYLFIFCMLPAFHLELPCCLEGRVEAMHL